MALVPCGTTIYNGRKCEVSYDTDDMDQLSYHYYCRAKKMNKYGIARRLLKREITGEDIENDPCKYGDLID